MEKIKPILTKIALALVAIGLIASLGYSLYLTMNKGQLEKQIRDDKVEASELNKKLSTALANSQSWQAKLAESQTQCTNDNQALKATIEAFAKQASACDRIKKKLNIND
ncbi:MAG TPA: hypothetical protein VK832_02450 [Burkholderiaceae bacterium]|jgi:hypothetical protein|nr:hypothetical protein [Burkholderiaceae bacterium]